MNRCLVAVLTSLLCASCVDVTIPDLTRELGEGRTDGPYCSPDKLSEFPPEELRVTLIDIGQGDGIWIQTPYYDNAELESRNILIDAGPSGSVVGTSPGGAVIVDYLLTNGFAPGEFIDAMVVTHAHEDHYGGVVDITNAFEVGRYVDPGFTAGSSGFTRARAAATADVQNKGGTVHVPAIPGLVPRTFTQTDLFGQYVEAYVINSLSEPLNGNSSSPSGTDINNTSVAFAIRWSGQQVLLLADLEEEAESLLASAHDSGEFNLSSAVLKVAHHGSSSSSSRAFLARVFPTAGPFNWAVISSGRRSFSGVTLPTEETLMNLQEVLLPNHILSTENRDEIKGAGTEHGDDHILVTIDADGTVEACYIQSSAGTL